MQSIIVTEVIDRSPLGALQWRVVGLCALLALIDGFDAQAIGFVAKLLSEEFSISDTSIGVIFSAGLLGLMVGAFALSPVADRVGRKPVIIASCLVMGVFSLLTAAASNSEELVIARFLTGVGLGGVMPNINTLTSEYAPVRHRAMLMTLMFLGFPLGGAVGGALCGYIISIYGWQIVFVIGGVIPLILSVLLVFWLPESICFLTGKNAKDPKIRHYLSKIDSHFNSMKSYQFSLPKKEKSSSIAALFRGSQMRLTLILWGVFFFNLLMMYTLLNWLPVIMTEAGLSLQNAIYTTVAFNGGGIFGGIVIARLIDKYSSLKILACFYLLTAICIALLGYSGNHLEMALLVAAGAGFCITGNQLGLNAYAVSVYPTHARSTGLGWALAVGRLGSVVGPFVFGAMKSLGWMTADIFLLIAVPAICCVILVGVLYRITFNQSLKAD